MEFFDKKELRRRMKSERSALTERDRRRKDALITLGLKNFIVSQKLNRVWLFKAFGSEPDLIPLCAMLSAIDSAFEFALPKVDTQEKGRMTFVPFQLGALLTNNRYGIEEPDQASMEELLPDERTLILLPALAVDQQGIRLGYGGGYYDRYLRLLPPKANPLLMAVVYQDFFVRDLPQEQHDVRVQWVMTESSLFRI